MTAAARLAAISLSAAIGSTAPAAVFAQITATLDAGPGSILLDGGTRTGVLVAAPSLSLERSRWTLAAFGIATQFASGGTTSQGAVAASYLSPPLGLLRAALSARGESGVWQTGYQSSEAIGQVRVHLAGWSRGAYVGGAAGSAWRGSRPRAVASWDAGAWRRVGAALIRLSVTRGFWSDSSSRPGTPPDTLYRRVTGAYTDWETGVRWAEGPLELDGAFGRRLSGHARDATLWNLSGTYWLARFIALLAGAGRYSEELAQGLPGGRYVTLSIRLALTPRPATRRPPARPPSSLARLEVTAHGADRYTIVVRAEGARSVELMGDFTDWRPVALARDAAGRWALTLTLAPGTHRLNLRVDGGVWTVPPGLTMTRDDFNGVVGLLTVGG